MADLVRTAQYFKVTIADKSGTLGHMLAPLHDAGVNLLTKPYTRQALAARIRDALKKSEAPSAELLGD